MRLFIALPLPDEALDDIGALQSRMPKGRMVDADNLHLTLAFLGECDAEEAEAAHDALDGLRAPAVSTALAGPAIYGGRHGQAVALEADAGAPLFELHDRLRGRLRGAGLVPERRRFRPHVTLTRLPGRADASGCLQALLGARLGPYLLDRVVLFSSVLHPDGAIHEPLMVRPLDRELP
ncbi:RNA 2',3'-cyclic phosphodiesterase [Citreimonas sp.]|uniref:RNA 2',3'-cyclic phosphodiesterase n=1 Tax=Citreimonas sp. TaxID=3036715 RepID=UPI0035C84BBA